MLFRSLSLNVDKCVFGSSSVDFLGHSVSAAGIQPLPSRVAALRDFPKPSTIKELQAFLGLFNFYRRFVPAAAQLVLPLTDALKGGRPGGTAISWSSAMESSFAAAKSSLSDAALLDHPSQAAEIALVVDASASHVGAALQQRRQGGGWQPLGF